MESIMANFNISQDVANKGNKIDGAHKVAKSCSQ